MSKVLKPLRLGADPTSPNAAKQWKHWKRTFDNFTAECGDAARGKFCSIFNFLSAEVFDYVEECTAYDTVIETLERLYVKIPNKIFARHELATRKQRPGESLDKFLEELKKICKNCNFSAVTAEAYRSEMIRDSFINGITSNYIRQRLLENAELSLDRACEIARTLHTAQKSSELHLQQIHQLLPTNIAATPTDEQTNPSINQDHESLSVVKRKITSKKSCYFCGGFLHANRATCPAREAICHNCSKRGQFAKVCQSAKKAATVSVIYKPSLCTITAACPFGFKHASVPALINGKVSLTALIDSCSSDNFISENAFKRLQIPASPSSKKVTMASTSMETPISGQCNVTIEVNGRKYQKVRLDNLQNLYSDVILGYDFQKQHKNLIFCFGGSKEDLMIKSCSPKTVSALEVKHAYPQSSVAHVADVDPPTLFKRLPDNVKPIATKSRFFNKDDRAFIRDQTSSLLAAC